MDGVQCLDQGKDAFMLSNRMNILHVRNAEDMMMPLRTDVSRDFILGFDDGPLALLVHVLTAPT